MIYIEPNMLTISGPMHVLDEMIMFDEHHYGEDLDSKILKNAVL